MDNAAVIDALRVLIAALNERLSELQDLQNAPGGPLEERQDRQMQVFSRISSMNVRILHLQNSLNERELAESVGRAVPSLDTNRRSAMTDALTTVNRSIKATGDFKAAIALAENISKAASSAGSASVPV